MLDPSQFDLVSQQCSMPTCKCGPTVDPEGIAQVINLPDLLKSSAVIEMINSMKLLLILGKELIVNFSPALR